MRKKAGKVLLIMAAALTVLIGKSSGAKAYEVVGGTAYLTWADYEEAERTGTLPENHMISDAYERRDDMAGDINMAGYVPSWYFDYDWYLQKHPELVSICGTDKNAIYSYYANIGQAAGWHGRIAPDKLIGLSNFDYMRYAVENPDVAAFTGQDAAVLYYHYINSGIKEGRKGYSTDPNVNALVKMYDISAQIITEDMSDMEKIKAVHDWMCLNIAYDYENYVNGTWPFQTIATIMNDGKAVCDGYVKTFYVFMEIQGIECERIAGTVRNSTYAHAWNRVKVDGEYYYIDVTWDDPVPDVPGRIRYDYYLTKDSTFGGTHLSFEEDPAFQIDDEDWEE